MTLKIKKEKGFKWDMNVETPNIIRMQYLP